MSRRVILGAGSLALLLAVAGWRIRDSSGSSEIPFAATTGTPPAAPLCPWREPAEDLNRFFPDATRYQIETRILSGRRVELGRRLGRAPTGDENALHIYRIYQEQTPLGAVLTRRVKGVYGAIELVLAVGAEGATLGLRLQRLREPEPIASALQNPDWLRAFAGRRADGSVQWDVPAVPPEARASASAVVEGVRSLLILLAATNDPPPRHPAAAHRH